MEFKTIGYTIKDIHILESSYTNVTKKMHSFLPLRKAQSGFTHDDAWRQRAMWLRDSLLAPSAPPPHPPGSGQTQVIIRQPGTGQSASHLFSAPTALPSSVLYGGYYLQLFFLGWYGGSFQK